MALVSSVVALLLQLRSLQRRPTSGLLTTAVPEARRGMWRLLERLLELVKTLPLRSPVVPGPLVVFIMLVPGSNQQQYPRPDRRGTLLVPVSVIGRTPYPGRHSGTHLEDTLPNRYVLELTIWSVHWFKIKRSQSRPAD